MPGQPHYKNSKVSMNNWEPVYHSLFNVTITPPPTVDKWDYVLESITKIAGMATDQTPASAVEQSYRGAKRRFASALPDATTVDLTIGFNVNLDDSLSMISYKGLRKWSDLIWNPLNGSMSLKKDYVGGPIVVSLFNRAGQPFRQWTFPVVWPSSSMAPEDLDFADGGAIYSIDMNFAADFWEDVTI